MRRRKTLTASVSEETAQKLESVIGQLTRVMPLQVRVHPGLVIDEVMRGVDPEEFVASLVSGQGGNLPAVGVPSSEEGTSEGAGSPPRS